MIEFLAFGDLRALGKKWDVKELNKYLDTTPLNSVQRYVATLTHRFSLDKKCAVMFFKAPKMGDENIEGIKFLRDMYDDEVLDVYNYMLGFSMSHFGERYEILSWGDDNVYMLVKENATKGRWGDYGECFITGKDGISISAE